MKFSTDLSSGNSDQPVFSMKEASRLRRVRMVSMQQFQLPLGDMEVPLKIRMVTIR